MATLKKTKKRVIAGVCGGIAKAIDPEINPLGIRLLWFFFGFVSSNLHDNTLCIFGSNTQNRIVNYQERTT